MAHKPAKMSFLIYDDKKGPVFLNTNRFALKFTLYVLPIITVLSILVIIAGSVYFKQIREMARRKEPAIIKELKATNAELNSQLQQISALNQEFEQKLSSTSTDGVNFSSLAMFKPVPGQTDLSTTPALTVDDIDFEAGDKKLKIKFNIINQTKNGRKLAGYIHILMSSPNKISFYPIKEIASEDMLISYNQGESFAFSRLRNVDATFDLTGFDEHKVLFKILIFSRTGDLLLKKLVAKDLK
ncbi:hypothetical protein BIY24_06160 [Halobacteriovorax marinus]|uniref:hypothetical protein n=1 Tax=Halobacteriovorax marinus TaxID=97084 RepID=UPI000BC34A7E|nr:hypothetical protein [Halobacteriovorax marinus]ATH07541.1 hypothetical protein BIY24_06160 [Halobacteriovorax marinus]